MDDSNPQLCSDGILDRITLIICVENFSRTLWENLYILTNTSKPTEKGLETEQNLERIESEQKAPESNLSLNK